MAGSSIDYASYQGIKFSFIVELQKFGKSGFEPKICEIIRIGKETFIGVREMVYFVQKYLRRTRYTRSAEYRNKKRCKNKEKKYCR